MTGREQMSPLSPGMARRKIEETALVSLISMTRKSMEIIFLQSSSREMKAKQVSYSSQHGFMKEKPSLISLSAR